MTVSICNRFHTIQANNGKITSFQRVSSLTPEFEEKPCTQRNEITCMSRKSRDLEAAHGKDFVMLACTFLIQLTTVTDRQTDRRPGHG